MLRRCSSIFLTVVTEMARSYSLIPQDLKLGAQPAGMVRPYMVTASSYERNDARRAFEM